jgi:outer membrane protein OmpA-like peptidoglycan-associated protein/tetratricopeptide (TPR) repeat protein
MIKKNTLVVKKYISIISIIFLIIGSTSESFADGKIDSLINEYNHKRANKAYEDMAYIKAIDIYNQLVKKNYINPDIYRNLSNSYYKTSQYDKAEEHYKNLLTNYEYQPEDVYTYAQILKNNGKYKESDRWLNTYAGLNTDDSRSKRQANTGSKISEIKAVYRFDIETVSFNSKFADFGPALRNDKLYFASERREDAVVNFEYAWKEAPYLDIYEVNLDGVVTSPKFLKGKVNSKYHDGPASFSKDGSEMFFTRNNSVFRFISKKGDDNVNNLKIYYAQYINGDLTNPIELSFNSENYSCGHPSLSDDGKTLYFTSDMPGGYGGSDIYLTERTGSGWSKPENLGSEINTEGDEMFPFIHKSGILFFASNGHLGLGGLDLYKAEMDYGKYKIDNMGFPLNSEHDDFALIINEEQKEGYFSSNREGGKGDDDIYKFYALDVNLSLRGKVFDIETKEQIEKPSIVLVDSKGESMRLFSSSDEFDFKIEVEPNESYTLHIDKEGYTSQKVTLKPSEMDKIGNIVEHNIYMTQVPVWGVFGKIYYKESLKEIPEVNVHVTNVNTGKVENYMSDDEGLFRIQLDQNTDYKFFFEKKGIFSIRADYTTRGREAGWVNADEFIELAFEKLELNKKIEIPNIYYDLGKWNIRSDAAKELDNVVQFLVDNPNIKIELGSHTDARGSAKSNQSLSQKRAQSAVDYIVSKGIAGTRISAKGYGESQLKNRCADGVQCSKEEHQENRRSEIRITGINE